MELDKALKERRSARKFLDKDVSWLLMAEILDAGRLAPSSGNIQNWYFIVVRSKEVKEKIAKHSVGSEWIVKTPVLIVVCADVGKGKRMYGSRGEGLYSIQNCANAALQMMLKATDLGLGSCWIGSFDEDGLIRDLEIRDGVKPQVVIALGYSTEKKESKRADLNTMVFFDKFRERERKQDFSMLPLSVPAKRHIEPMRERLKKSFEAEGLGEHKEKLKKFIDRFSRKKK